MPKHQKNLDGYNYATVTLKIKYQDRRAAYEALLEVTRTLDRHLGRLVLVLAGAEIECDMVEEPEKPKDPTAHLGGMEA